MPGDFHNLFSVNKLQYIKEKSSGTGCILCSIAKKDADVVNLVVADGKKTVVCVNKFPYNSGHLLIFPKRHITDYREFLEEEESEINKFLKTSLDVLDSTYSPSGYNFGYNTGEFAGASIAHIHMHVIPRYRNELGFIDIIGGAKILVENPTRTMEKLKEGFKKIS